MRLLLTFAVLVSLSSRAAERERRAVVADFSIGPSLGVLVAGGGSGAIGGLGLHGSVAYRVSPFAALGVVADTQAWFTGGLVFLGTIAPAVRLGDVGHVTIALGPSLLVLAMYRGGVGLMGTLLVHGGFPLHDAFGIHPQLSLSVSKDLALVGLGFGFGGSVY